MNAADFRRIALRLEGAIEDSHMGAADFRVGGRIFATLASEKQGFGNLMLTPEVQAEFVEKISRTSSCPWRAAGDEMAPRIFVWRRRMRIYSPELCGTAWKLRVDKNAKTGATKRPKR